MAADTPSVPARSDLKFGPPGDEWCYERGASGGGIFDLTRGHCHESPPRLTIPNTTGADIRIAPALSALVVVDMQNFFLHPSCRHHPTGLAAVERTVQLVEACRAAGVQIIWLNWGLTDADLSTMPASVLRGFARTVFESSSNTPGGSTLNAGLGADLGDGKGRCLVAGEWNAQLYGPLADVATDRDMHCAKNRMSGLWSTSQPLFGELSRRGTRTLLFAGVNTDQCVLGTLADAYNAGWDCVMVEDCCATGTPGAREVCFWNVSRCYGFVTTSQAVVEAVRRETKTETTTS